MKMNRTTGQIVKPIMILIIICCLCVTTINCDRNLDRKRSVLGHHIEQPDVKIINLSQSHDGSVTSEVTSVPLSSETKNSNVVRENPASVVRVTEGKTGTLNLTSTNNNASNVNPVNNNNSTTVEKKPGISPNIQPPINNGALLRGASVFLGLSIVVVAYIIFRCARLNKNRTQMVRKYGILAHRQDVEMRPLPLNDEDEDDNTVFDASEIAAIHDKQRRMT